MRAAHCWCVDYVNRNLIPYTYIFNTEEARERFADQQTVTGYRHSFIRSLEDMLHDWKVDPLRIFIDAGVMPRTIYEPDSSSHELLDYIKPTKQAY